MRASILINNFNYGRYLSNCIESVINQTYDNIEIIFYDDGSTDDSLKIAKQYEGKIKIISRPNYGKYPSFNQANGIFQSFLASSGDIIFLLDSDDMFSPDKIEKVMKKFENEPSIVMIQHKMFEINENGIKTGHIRHDLLFNIDILNAIKSFQRLDLFFMQTSALCFRREYLQKVFPLSEDKFPLVWPDVRLTRAAPFYGKVFTVEEPLGSYRIHASNDSNKLKSIDFLNKVIDQQYQYFNQLAEKENFKPIKRKNDVIAKAILAFKIAFLKIPYKNKIAFFKKYI